MGTPPMHFTSRQAARSNLAASRGLGLAPPPHNQKAGGEEQYSLPARGRESLTLSPPPPIKRAAKVTTSLPATVVPKAGGEEQPSLPAMGGEQ